MSKNSPIPEDARERLLSRVDTMRKSSPLQPPKPVAATAVDKRFTDFSTLPGYDELRLQRSIGDKFGLENPYFRMHDARAGAVTEIGGKPFINFSCYDYLGLNGHPEVVEAAKAAMDRYGISCSASRIVAGERIAHRALERALADHYSADDAVVFVSGYGTNVSVIASLAGAKDLVVSDAVVHNSAVVGSVLSGASRRSFAHNDLDNLEQILAANRSKYERAVIVVEGLYSMDGDYPDLPRLIDIKTRYQAWLMVDEAHALGVLGKHGYGIAEHFGVDPRQVDVWMGTMSKTLAGCGGYIAGSAALIDYLKCLSNGFVYSVGIPPLLAASVAKSLEIMHREPERVAALQRNGAYFYKVAKAKGLDTGNGCGTAVSPIVVGDSVSAVVLSQQLFRRGINVQPVLYPAVPAKSSRLRFFLTAMHTEEQIETAIDAMAEELAKIPESMRSLKFPGYA
ncbi:MAG TPA: aminotransferase class I/II-fold pyridoxal phosphate-dependent enzyme [Xanthobacteraceae bacterium]|nr:aminotransferase class I/II-fold pyridoxal phosphate-dependent enzyme [Xanthobacteraceae bacterium]